MKARKQWAEEHMSWTLEQWSQILWTDETWVNGLRHSRMVTRMRDETHLPDCVTAKVRKSTGWMFWGSFNGNEKGPFLFWEKDWGSILAKKYCRYMVPRIVGKLELNPALQLMQDGAPAHAAQKTRDELFRYGIPPIFWPAFSPDLNPIESVWEHMKSYIDNYPEPDGRRTSLRRLHDEVLEAWESVTPDQLYRLIGSMPTRCQALINANRGPIPYQGNFEVLKFHTGIIFSYSFVVLGREKHWDKKIYDFE